MTFFDDKQAAAVLKHALLDGYIHPFAMKTGSRSPGKRVVFVDGYAGEGLYGDGSDGSPMLVVKKAHALAGQRDLQSVFIEKDHDCFEKLSALVASRAGGLSVTVLEGHVEDHLPAVTGMVSGLPVFYFFDPFGRMFPFTTIETLFSGRPKQFGAPATEIMINFSANALRRTAGLLTSPTPVAGTLMGMDEMCGGAWWRDVWMSHMPDKNAAEAAVVDGYAERLRAVAGGGTWTIDVRKKPTNKPVYYLIFLSRHIDGLSIMAESLSLGMVKWRRFLHDLEYADSLMEPYADDEFKIREAALKDAWIDAIEANLVRMLGEGQPFQISRRYDEVYGTALGLARELHLRAAWKRVHAAGLTPVDSRSVGKQPLIQKTIRAT